MTPADNAPWLHQGWAPSPRGPVTAPPDALKSEEGPSTLESVGRGALQGATAGFSDEGIGGAQALFDKYIKNNPEALVELYRKHRDEERAKNQAAQEAHPVAYGASGLAGGVGAGLLTGGASLPAAVGFGAANALGESGADLTKGDVGGALKDTATGAVAGGVLHGAGALVGKVAKGVLTSGGKDAAMEQGAKALGLSQAHIADLADRGDLERVVQQAEKDGVFTPGGSLRETSERFQAARQAKTDALKGAIAAADQKGPSVNLTAMREEMEQKLAEQGKSIGNVGEGYANGMQKAIDHIKKFETAPAGPSAEDLAKAGVSEKYIKGATGGETQPTMINATQAQTLKKGLQDTADYSAAASDKPAEKAMEDAAAIARKHLIASDPQVASALEESHAYEAAGRAQKRDSMIKKTSAQGGIGASTAPVAAGMLALSGHPVGAATGLAAMAVQKQARQRANSAAYWLMKKASGDGGQSMSGKLAQLLTTNPGALGHYSGVLSQALANGGEDKLNQTHYVLSQTDPKYRNMMEQVHAAHEGELGGLPPADEATE